MLIRVSDAGLRYGITLADGRLQAAKTSRLPLVSPAATLSPQQGSILEQRPLPAAAGAQFGLDAVQYRPLLRAPAGG